MFRSSSCSKKPVVWSSSSSASWRNSLTAERLRQPSSSPCSSSAFRRSSTTISGLLPNSPAGLTRVLHFSCKDVTQASELGPYRRIDPDQEESHASTIDPVARGGSGRDRRRRHRGYRSDLAVRGRLARPGRAH